MTPTILTAVLTALATALVGWLGYLATRKRDAPQTALERDRLELEDSRAALEAWAEYATTVRSDLAELREALRFAEGRLIVAQTERAESDALLEAAKQRLLGMESRVEALQQSLEACLAQHWKHRGS